MESTVSVSKGVFVFKNGAKAASKRTRVKKKSVDSSNGGIYSNTLWYQSYMKLWNKIESKIQDLNNDMFSQVLSSLVAHVKSSYSNPVTEVPTAALLTGINMPDHAVQFKALKDEIKEQVSPHVAVLNGEDCQNLKYVVESICNQLIGATDNSTDDEDSKCEKKIKKSQCNFSLLQNWFESLYNFENLSIATPPKKLKTYNNPRKVLVIIFPDFEGFVDRVLQDFILIANSYINILPFVLIFGISTSLTALHRSLPYQVSSKINLRVFHSQPSTIYLNNVLENVLFKEENSTFHLGGKVFNLFTDIFLFYDLSVSGFIQNLKYAILEHFSYGNAMAICCNHKVIQQLTTEDLKSVRRLLSFRKLVESETAQNRIKLLTDDEFFKTILTKEVEKIQQYLKTLHLFIRCLHKLTWDLPKAPLGKQIRELYSATVSKNLTQSKEYKECFQLLKFQSKSELCLKITKIIAELNEGIKGNKIKQVELELCVKQLNDFLNNFNSIHLIQEEGVVAEVMRESNEISGQMNRKQLREKLVELSKRTKPLDKYEEIKLKILDYLTEIFEKYLCVPNSFYFHEIFFFNDISIQNHIIGSHRAAIHTALSDPHNYLQCNCCEISDYSKILATMPDISIAYKLHLECGKMINLYDWLQAFLSVIDPQKADEDDSKRLVKPELQARFTQAVAELEFLGFIKSSKRKTDHVARLTWGG